MSQNKITLNCITELIQKIDFLLKDCEQNISHINNKHMLLQIKSKLLGKNSLIYTVLQELPKFTIDERKILGKHVNEAKNYVCKLVRDKLLILNQKVVCHNNNIDLTIPYTKFLIGKIHPISAVTNEIINFFSRFGCSVIYGPSIESDWYNFKALNIDEDHPARLMHDTFYLRGDKLLRTHTSPAQIRAMERLNPPIRCISTGRVYRVDLDATHTPTFHQLEAFFVDTDITIGHLKYIITQLISECFMGKNYELRFRPSFFPFTVPSFEVDIKTSNDWMEIMGCGMIHPNVFTNCNIDNTVYKGFALGLGIERFAMLKYKISDMRQFFACDMRWLRHFGLNFFDIINM